MDDELARILCGEHNVLRGGVRFARSAGKHRVAREDVMHAIRNAQRVAAQPAPHPHLDDRVIVLGPARDGDPLEIAATLRHDGVLLVIHAMPARRRYRSMLEEELHDR